MTHTIVMIHGMFSTGPMWVNFRQHFEALGYRVETPTLRHHDVDPAAPPPAGLGTTSLLDYAADLERLIDGLGGGQAGERGARPILMGHSMGALLTQMLAARGRARAAILLTPAAPAGIVALTPSVIRAFGSYLLTWGLWRKAFRATWKEISHGMLNTMSEAEARATYAAMVHESGRAAAEIAFWPFDRGHAARVPTAAVNCPLLIVAGGRDRVTPASVVRKVARKYHRIVDYKEFPELSHWVLGEPRWREVADHCANWLGRKDLTADRAP